MSNSEFYGLNNQLPELFLIVGDFNAHKSLLGGSRTDKRGRLIEIFLVTSGVCSFNRKEPTYHNIDSIDNIAHTSFSSIDLALGSSMVFPDRMESDKNLFGDDHFQVTPS